MPTGQIDSLDLALGKLFDDFYVVPDFQREYVWEEADVEQLLQDVHAEYSSTDTPGGLEYFLGTLVVTRANGVFEVIDGQQRLTTFFLFFCAIRDHLLSLTPPEHIGNLSNLISAVDVDSQGHDVHRYRVDLQYEDSGGLLRDMAESGDPGVRPAATRSIRNLLGAYTTIRTFLNSEFGDNATEAKKFYAFFTRQLKLVRVTTSDLTSALKVFETINDRGVGLDPMDLLKNLLFINTARDQFEVLKGQWKELVDTIHRAREKPLRFLRYFIFATYNVDRLREDEIYRWFRDNEAAAGYADEPMRFVEGLLRSAKAYAHFVNGRDALGVPNRYLTNITYMSRAAKQHLILLLAGTHLHSELFERLCAELEDLFFAYLIVGERTNEFERNFAQWAPELRASVNEQAFEEFVINRLHRAKEAIAPRFRTAFETLHESHLQKYRLRYVLGKLTQKINEDAYGSSGAAAELNTFVNNQVDVEHILAQSPTEVTVAEFDAQGELDRYQGLLGNLTLLEEPYNSSVGNKRFVEKQELYAQSNFLLTRVLGGPVPAGTNTSVRRATRALSNYSDWLSASIEQRQLELTALAHKTWSVPIPPSDVRALVSDS